jgi:hypothetical protein
MGSIYPESLHTAFAIRLLKNHAASKPIDHERAVILPIPPDLLSASNLYSSNSPMPTKHSVSDALTSTLRTCPSQATKDATYLDYITISSLSKLVFG